jgi:guanine nucleotide-binding protein G(i) subunit alpha
LADDKAAPTPRLGVFCSQLQEKVFKEYVKTYDGPNEMKPCADHVKGLMLDRCKNKEKSIFTHVTTAIDTSNVKFVFNAVVAMILEANLKASGLA